MIGIAPGLDDIRIIDLSQETAGPYCTFLLGAFGADVIKVEPPGKGDRSRQRGPFRDDQPHSERSAPFLYLNRNKRGVTLDIHKDQGRRILLQLVKTPMW